MIAFLIFAVICVGLAHFFGGDKVGGCFLLLFVQAFYLVIATVMTGLVWLFTQGCWWATLIVGAIFAAGFVRSLFTKAS